MVYIGRSAVSFRYRSVIHVGQLLVTGAYRDTCRIQGYIVIHVGQLSVTGAYRDTCRSAVGYRGICDTCRSAVGYRVYKPYL